MHYIEYSSMERAYEHVLSSAPPEKQYSLSFIRNYKTVVNGEVAKMMAVTGNQGLVLKLFIAFADDYPELADALADALVVIQDSNYSNPVYAFPGYNLTNPESE